jgi:hypothetical protein
MNRINDGDDGDKEMHKNLCTSALVLLDQILMDASANPVRAIEGLLKTIRVSQDVKQQTRLSLVSEVENNHMEEEELETCESSVPTLSQIGLPVTKHLVSYLLLEIVALLCLNPACGLLSYQTHCGTSCELVKVTRSKNKESFVINVK